MTATRTSSPSSSTTMELGMPVQPTQSPTKKLRPAGAASGVFALWWALMWIAVNYTSSVWTGLNTKVLVGERAIITPLQLTFWHLLTSISIDCIVVVYQSWYPPEAHREVSWQPQPNLFRLSTVLPFLPVGFCVLGSKLATYISISHVDVSLTHTVKASEPLFNALLAALWWGETHSMSVYLSLIPIAFGVSMSSLSALSYNHLGFGMAVLAAMLKVLQNMSVKRVMQRNQYTFFQLHLFTAIPSLVMLAPGVMLQGFTASPGAFLPVLVSCIVQHLTSVSAYLVLSLVSHLSFAITNSVRRAVIILSSIIYFSRPITPFNIVGVTIALCGVAAYNYVRQRAKLAPLAAHDYNV